MRPEETPNRDKWSLCEDIEETFALLFDDPEGGAAGLTALLKNKRFYA